MAFWVAPKSPAGAGALTQTAILKVLNEARTQSAPSLLGQLLVHDRALLRNLASLRRLFWNLGGETNPSCTPMMVGNRILTVINNASKEPALCSALGNAFGA